MTGKKHWRAHLPTIIGSVLALLLIGFIVKAIVDFIDKKPAKSDKKIQPITLLKPPPPPPPPPKVEKPPEPDVKEKIKEPEPEPDREPLPESKPDNGPPGSDGPGDGSGDCIGVNCLPGSRRGSGPPGSVNHWYAGQVKNEIKSLLDDHEELRRKGYFAIIKVWLKADGSVERIELSQGSDDEEIDSIIKRLLNKFRGVSEPIPVGMEQPLKYKLKVSGVR